MSLTTIERTVYYYHLRFEFDSIVENEQENLFRDLFAKIKDMADPPLGRERDPNRFLEIGGKKLYINEIKFNPTEKNVEGKLRSIRTDAYPNIFDLGTDEEEGIHIAEGKGLVETTHFIIDYSKSRKTLALEFNVDGARFVDLWDYLRKFGKERTTLKEIHWKIVSTKGGLEKTFSRMNAVSEIIIKVIPERLGQIQKKVGLFSSFGAAEDYGQPDYYKISAKFSLPKKGMPRQSSIKILDDIKSMIFEDPGNIEFFEELKVYAQDGAARDKVELFDLIVDKIKTKHYVQKTALFKSIVSNDMFDKMRDGLRAKLENINTSYSQIKENYGDVELTPADKKISKLDKPPKRQRKKKGTSNSKDPEVD